MSGIISIQGNLGAGKTTLLQLLDLQSIQEPVQEWQNMAGKNLLKSYYEDPKRWAFTFQLYAVHSRSLLWNNTIKENPQQLHFAERSPLADRQIFGQLMYREGNMSECEYTIYSTMCAKLSENSRLKGIIYLRCTPELCLERIRKRNREAQKSITLEYLQKVHRRHEEWLADLKDVPILTVDTGIHDICSKNGQQVVKTMIEGFINQHKSTKRAKDTLQRKTGRQTTECQPSQL